jgi:streptogramin lyase
MGQVELGGPKVQGIAVNIGARVMAKAEGDEVLVSSTVRDALAGAAIAFDDRGTHVLKGIPGEWHLFSVESDDRLVARALGNEPVEIPGDGGPSAPWFRQKAALAALAAVALIAIAVGVLLARKDTLSPFTPAVNTVVRLDLTDASIVGGYAVGDTPLGVAADDTSVWVANFGSTVTKVDPAGGTAPTTLGVSVASGTGNPKAVVIGGGSTWVAVGGDRGAVNRFLPDQSTPKRYDLTTTGVEGIAYGADSVWVTNSQTGELVKIDPATGASQSFGLEPDGGLYGLAFGDGSLWVADGLGHKALLRVDPADGRVIATIPLRGDPKGVAFGEGAVWVTLTDADLVQRIDPANQHGQVTDTIDTGLDGPEGVAAGEGGVWVTYTNSRTIVRIDPGSDRPSAQTQLAEGLVPQGVALGAGSVWVTVTAP